MANEDDVRADAMQLLWAMHQQRVGDQVNPSGAAHAAGLVPHTPRWKAAVDYLVRERAIELDEEASGLAFTGSDRDPFYRITPHGMAMLSGFMPN
jgi:hypothetical protein